MSKIIHYSNQIDVFTYTTLLNDYLFKNSEDFLFQKNNDPKHTSREFLDKKYILLNGHFNNSI